MSKLVTNYKRKTGRLFMRGPMAERFWQKVEKMKKVDECWNWLGACLDNGYGCFGVRKGLLVKAHRIAFQLVKGPIPSGLLILHKCDNKICVNPNHLFLGSQKDNIADAMRKGRFDYTRNLIQFRQLGD